MRSNRIRGNTTIRTNTDIFHSEGKKSQINMNQNNGDLLPTRATKTTKKGQQKKVNKKKKKKRTYYS
jgi:hypothetical protein